MTNTPRPHATLTYETSQDEWTPSGWHVQTTWDAPVDRTDGLGWILSNEKTARRLVNAVNAGAVFVNVKITEDVNGRTYVAATARVMAKYANADLKKLGY